MHINKATRSGTAIVAMMLMSAAATANDDANLLTNPGFEDPNPASSGMPLGWNTFNLSSSDYVDIDDPGAFVRSGERSVRIRPATGESTRFQALTTNLFRPDGSDLYDPDYEYLGGDVTISGYYLVPDGEVLMDTVVGVKLEFRREPPNFSIWSAFEFSLPQTETDGMWIPFAFTVTDQMIADVGDFPPEPTSVSILPFRFFGGEFGAGTSPTGTVYFDDLCLVQGASVGPCNDADFVEPYGELSFFDVSAFLTAYNALDASADLNGDGEFNFFDVSAFLTAYSAGCP
ncbi:MAG: hypothetical protein CMJ35_15990 [Phycisphaerae bacterium]|nr:hypothetical protein [Phycisphaerae bacterium]MBM93089.1 hypothetical protein [Phycisphaerae bacterium]